MNILVINSGSSSLKYTLFDMHRETERARGVIERIGLPKARISHISGKNKTCTRAVHAPDHNAAVSIAMEALTHPSHGAVHSVTQIRAVGHRVVHGGEAFSDSTVITPKVKDAIKSYFLLAPLHN